MKSLQRLFNEKALSTADCVHIAVDVQNAYIYDNAEVADHIVSHIAPTFREAGIPTCWIYMTDPYFTYNKIQPCKNNELPTGYEQLYKLDVLPQGDWTQHKNSTSAFCGNGLETTLRGMNKQVLFVTGFSLAVCLGDTIRDAIRNEFNVVLLGDGTKTYSPRDLPYYSRGAIVARSDEALSFIRTL